MYADDAPQRHTHVISPAQTRFTRQHRLQPLTRRGTQTTEGPPALQMDKPTRAFHPQQETQEGVTQEVHRSEQGGDWKHTHVWTYFSTSYGLSCIQTDCETLLYFGHESTLTITSVKSICPQNSYSKTEMFHFSVIHNQSNFPSRKHLDTAVSCYAAPLVAVWPLASMLNQLDQIPNHLRHDLLPPKCMFCECNNTRNAVLTHCLGNTHHKTWEDMDYANWKTLNIMHYDGKLL